MNSFVTSNSVYQPQASEESIEMSDTSNRDEIVPVTTVLVTNNSIN